MDQETPAPKPTDEPSSPDLQTDGRMIVELFDRNPETISSIAVDLLVLDRTAFGTKFEIPADANALTREHFPVFQQEESRRILWTFTELLKIPQTVTVLLKNNGAVVGVTLATPIGVIEKHRRAESAETAYVVKTIILPKYQDKGYLGQMMERLEAELKRRGFRYFERHAMIDNGYAAKILKHYGERILDKSEIESERHGRQMFFRIRLD